MKKFIAFALLLLCVGVVSAVTIGEARNSWLNAKEMSVAAAAEYFAAKTTYNTDPTEENKQEMTEDGKALLNAALDEAEAWLVWRDVVAQESDVISDELKADISTDVATNIAKISALRTEVDSVDTLLNLGVTYLKILGKYSELIADVAKNVGKSWCEEVGIIAGKLEDYESKLRAIADTLEENTDIIAQIDDAKSELSTARANLNSAKGRYNEIKYPGTPLLKFAEGNSNLNAAKANLLEAQIALTTANNLIAGRGE